MLTKAGTLLKVRTVHVGSLRIPGRDVPLLFLFFRGSQRFSISANSEVTFPLVQLLSDDVKGEAESPHPLPLPR